MNHNIKLSFYLTLLVTITVLGCAVKKPDGRVVARVGKAVLTQNNLEHILGDQALSKESAVKTVFQWVNDELLYQAALKQGLQHDKSIQDAIDHFRRELLGRTYLETAMTSGIYVTQSEINAAYEKNLESFYLPIDEARINHFIIEDRNTARRVRRILVRGRSGADRKEVFATYPVETVTVKRGSLLPPIDEALFGLNSRGTVIGPISTDFGYHVIEVLKRYKEGSYRDLDDVFDELRHQLFQNHASLKSIKLLDSLRSVTDVEINLENINQ